MKTGRFAAWGDLWGGMAAMLVALPSAIAFGVTIYSALGADFAAQGAMAGILGATLLGLFASALGGTPRLISAPCAPAAAVLTAFAMQSLHGGLDPVAVLGMLTAVTIIAGLLQVGFGVVGVGRLIKYMPYPVVSGYLTGVGLIIILGQVPRLLGVAKGVSLTDALVSPALWRWQGIAVGLVTAMVMLLAPRLTHRVPAAILGLLSGVVTYVALGMADSTLLSVQGNSLLIGELRAGSGSDVGFWPSVTARWTGLSGMPASLWAELLVPALTLAVLLSIDTLKTCVVLDSLTRSRHNSNRELIGQGLGNLAATLVGGIPGAGTMGATLVNLSSGARSRASGVFEGVFSLAAFLLLGALIAWIPIAALAGILIVVGARMFDWSSLHLLKNRATVLDFVVIVAVVVVAETVSLIAASATGIGLAALLFIREKITTSCVRRKVYGDQVFSKQIRLPEEREILAARGRQSVIFELQGSLFFGTADQLYSAMEQDLKACTYVILDLRRVQSVDVTAAHVLEQIEDMLVERGAWLLFSQVPRKVPTGQDMTKYFMEIGLARPERHAPVFEELDDALEWVEDRILAEARASTEAAPPLALSEIGIFRGRKADTLADLEAVMDMCSLKAGEPVFKQGDTGDELYFIRRGSIRIMLPVAEGQAHHLATFGRGDFFGEMSFLDKHPRSADALAEVDTELYVLSRARFEEITPAHRKLATQLLDGMARALADRLRYTNMELRVLQAS